MFDGYKELRPYEERNLVLELDGTAFPFRSATAGGQHLKHWGKRDASVDRRLSLPWTDGQTVQVRILERHGSDEAQALPPPEPLTVEMEDMPESHDGTPFAFGLAFSEDVDITAEDMKDHALLVSGGTVSEAAMAEDGKTDLWEITDPARRRGARRHRPARRPPLRRAGGAVHRGRARPLRGRARRLHPVPGGP